ncbi:hypothetical protein D3C73_1393660 [compost metagenome]
MTSPLGRMLRFPGSPASSRNEANEAAIPVQIVFTGGLISCIVSKMPKPAEVEPPGLLIYM